LDKKVSSDSTPLSFARKAEKEFISGKQKGQLQERGRGMSVKGGRPNGLV